MSHEAPATALVRVISFLDAFRAAPNDADIELRIGKTIDGHSGLLISIDGDMHVLLCSEASKVADIMEDTMN